MKNLLAISGATLLLAGCNAAKAQGSPILSPLAGDKDNALVGAIQQRHPGTLCSLAPADGHARLMSYGNEAVVDLGSGPVLLSYRPGTAGRALFTGSGISISGPLERVPVSDLSHTASQDVAVDVEARGRSDHLQASWTCQASFITVRTGR